MSQKILLSNGKVTVFERDAAGAPINGAFIGDVSALSMSLAVEKIEHKESYSGQNAVVASVITGKTATLEMTCHDHSLKNLSRVLQGSVIAQGAGTVTDEALGTLASGAVVALSKINITAASITVNGAVAVDGVDYSLDKKTGLLTAITAGVYAAAEITHGASEGVSLFSASDKDYLVRFNGVNKVDGKPYVATFYKVRFAPAQTLNFIGSEFGSYAISGDVLLDETKPESGAFGQFGKIETVA